MRTNSRCRALLLCLAIGAAGCASPPSGDVELAKITMDKAVAAGAENFAVDSLKGARQAQAALDAELKAQHGKWLKSYDRAQDLAVQVQAAADKAATEALTRKAAAMTGATAATPA